MAKPWPVHGTSLGAAAKSLPFLVARLHTVAQAHPDPVSYLKSSFDPASPPAEFVDEKLDVNIYRYYVLVHDISDAGKTAEEVAAIFDTIKKTFKEANCHLLRINSHEGGKEAGDDMSSLWQSVPSMEDTPEDDRAAATASPTGSAGSGADGSPAKEAKPEGRRRELRLRHCGLGCQCIPHVLAAMGVQLRLQRVSSWRKPYNSYMTILPLNTGRRSRQDSFAAVWFFVKSEPRAGDQVHKVDFYPIAQKGAERLTARTCTHCIR